jgi:hypothetical protein
MNGIPLLRLMVLLMLLSSLTYPTSGDAPPASLIIRLADPTGASVTDALVVVHFERDSSVQASNTDQGQEDQVTPLVLDELTATYRINLAPGTYDIFVARPIFHPNCKKVRLEKGESLKIEMKLRYDPSERHPQPPPLR